MLFGTKSIILGCLLAMSLSAAGFARSTGDVWQHHIEAWEARDLDGIVGDYQADSILILNGKEFVGPKAIRQVFARLFNIFDQGDTKIDPVVIAGRVVFITWRFRDNDAEFVGTDTFVIEGGKITVQTIASPLYLKYPVRVPEPKNVGGKGDE